MCGIAGFNYENKELLKRMCRSIRHRGPDQHGIYTDKNVSLGHQRLSIIDLSEKGRQPMSNEDGSVIIVFNGEIYNFKELRKHLDRKHSFKSLSDTEVLIHGYEEWGIEELLKRLNGIFAFCIYDANKNTLVLARDHIGVKPLYYYFLGGFFSFSSELKGLLELPIKQAINKCALNKFLLYRYLPGCDTIICDVKKLLPGNFIIFELKQKKLSLQQYWDFSFSSNLIADEPQSFFEDKLKSLLFDAVEKQLVSDVPIGVFLSGGLDSSMLIGIMSKIKEQNEDNKDITTFSVGFNMDKNYDELGPAKSVSDFFSTDHHEIIVTPNSMKLLPKIIWHLDEPMADPAAIPNYILSEESKKKATVILTGAGADEVFAGYEHYKFLNIGNKFSGFPGFLRKKVVPLAIRGVPNFMMNSLFKYPVKLGKKGLERYTKFLTDCNNKPLAYLDVVSIFDETERESILNYSINSYDHAILNETAAFFQNKDAYLNNVLMKEIKHFLPEQVLFVVDRMNMASAVEGRVPFVDYRIVEFSARMPPSMKLRGLQDKFILRKAAKSLVPSQTIKRKKQGFYVPIDLWLNNDLKATIANVLSKESIREGGFFKHEYIQKMLDNYKASKLYYARQLWSILNFQIWHDIYIGKKKLSSVM